MTLEEALEASKQAEEENVLVVDATTRTIQVPESQKLFGTESDGKTERKYFRCPKIVGDNIDLTKMQLFVNWRNANGEKGSYLVNDVETSGEDITFSWQLQRTPLKYKGTISFILCAKSTGDAAENVLEWNTTLAQGEVLEGLEATEQIEEENDELIMQLIQEVDKAFDAVDKAMTKIDDGIGKEVADYMQKNPPKVELDSTLSQSGKAADAAATGAAIAGCAKGAGIEFSINDSGGLRVTYNTEE